jgi:Uma2 family endonuclease
VLHAVPWHAYVALRDTLDEPGVRMTFLEGELEIMTPGGPHEMWKTLFARLLEAWAEENDVDLEGHGSETFREEARARGLEPDECYSIGAMMGLPDIAIEVVVSRPLVDKMSVYAALGVPEVWVLRDGAVTIHRLVGAAYQVRTRSEVLPLLDVAHISGFLRLGASQTRTVRAYREELRARRGG